MRVIGLNADGESGCGYYRILLPLQELAKHGHGVEVCDLWTDERLTEAEDGAVVVGQRLGEPHEFGRWHQLMDRHRLVYEVDDNMFDLHETIVRAYPKLTNRSLRRDMARCIAVADLVTVSTKPLAERLVEFNPNVVVLPNHIDPALLEWERPRRDRVTVGWSGGNSHLLDLQVVASQLRRFLERHPDVDMHFVGTDYSRLVRRESRFTPFVNGVWNYYPNLDFDIGLAPLAPNVFNRSKSHIRVLEYAALGIPVIASDEPAYRDTVIDGVTGFLVRYEHEWMSRLRDLANDSGMREEMGTKARQHAANWSIADGWRLWETAYERALG